MDQYYHSLSAHTAIMAMYQTNALSFGRFRRYNFCLRLSHAISRARAARVMQNIAHNSRHSTLLIPMIVVGFKNMF